MTDPTMDGVFDIHITLAATSAPDIVSAFAERHGLKFTHIELDRGEIPSQPMLSTVASGPLDHARAEARRLAGAVDGRVVRIKVEAAPWNTGVPADDALAPADRYFEHHIKLLLDEPDVADLAVLVRPFGAHVSRNARRTRSDGRHERFVTQRCHGVGDRTAERRFGELLAALTRYRVLETEREYVVDDDNIDLDAGWIAAADQTN